MESPNPELENRQIGTEAPPEPLPAFDAVPSPEPDVIEAVPGAEETAEEVLSATDNEAESPAEIPAEPASADSGSVPPLRRPIPAQPYVRRFDPMTGLPLNPQPGAYGNVPPEAPVPPPPPYVYPTPEQIEKRRKRRPLTITLIVLASLLVLAGIVYGAYQVSQFYDTLVSESIFGYDEDIIPPEETPDDGEEEDPYSYYFSEEEEEEDDTASCYMTQLPLAPDVSICETSCEGLETLSYEEIYAQCIESVVSLTCTLNDGSYCTATGIIITSDGYIVTNEHVIEDVAVCQVMLHDGHAYDAGLIGFDEQSDLAVIKIDRDGLTPAVFGTSDELIVGNTCVAIGDPLGTSFRGTMTTGIISAMNRNVSVNGYSMNLIQTDCAINSGNSGGPLINMYGQVVGICNMKMMSSATTVEGLGFAIPTNTIVRIVNKLLANGEIVRAMLGITAYNLSVDQCEEFGIDSGICVAAVSEFSNAYELGIVEDDIITAVDGIPVTSVDMLNTYKADMSPGDQITLTILRDGEYTDYTVTLMEQSLVK